MALRNVGGSNRVIEHPILFSTPMVQAILAGRKTMTRRVLKPYPTMPIEPEITAGVYADWYAKSPEIAFWLKDNRMTEPRTWKCPYGQVGDRLWVRETWKPETVDTNNKAHSFFYLADAPENIGTRIKWKPSIHMPRRASRITLEIINIRVERVQEITPSDVIAEGITEEAGDGLELRDKFNSLWDSINGKKAGRSWDDNPWVWVVEFKGCQQ